MWPVAWRRYRLLSPFTNIHGQVLFCFLFYPGASFMESCWTSLQKKWRSALVVSWTTALRLLTSRAREIWDALGTVSVLGWFLKWEEDINGVLTFMITTSRSMAGTSRVVSSGLMSFRISVRICSGVVAHFSTSFWYPGGHEVMQNHDAHVNFLSCMLWLFGYFIIYFGLFVVVRSKSRV